MGKTTKGNLYGLFFFLKIVVVKCGEGMGGPIVLMEDTNWMLTNAVSTTYTYSDTSANE
jgi:hypothetical protein